jgi:beta-barrel assembly-enhancing protease
VRTALLIWTCALLVGCAAGPRPEPLNAGQRPALETDVGGLWFAMDEAERELKNSPLLERDPALNAYVRELACRLADEHCRDLRVYLINRPLFNAAMAPNGMMLVFSGLLLRVENEAQLAFVISHEIGHFRLQHSVQQWRKLKNTQNFLTAFSVVTAGLGAGVVGLAASLGAYADLASFSREQEREADRFGFERISREGYDPSAPAKSFTDLLREVEARDDRGFSAFASHPPTEDRARDLAEQAALAEPAKRTERERFLRETLRFRGRWLADELARRNFAQSSVLLERLGATDASGEFQFYRGELYRKRAQAGDRERALAAYRMSVALPNAPATAFRELGLLSNDPAEKRRALSEYLRRAPDAVDRGLIEGELK